MVIDFYQMKVTHLIKQITHYLNYYYWMAQSANVY